MTIIRIPRANAKFGGNVPVTINGVTKRIPVGVDYDASAAEIEVLTRAGVTIGTDAPPAGSIIISPTHGSRIATSLNGVITYLPTGVPLVATPFQLLALQDKGIGYRTQGSGASITPTPEPAATFDSASTFFDNSNLTFDKAA